MPYLARASLPVMYSTPNQPATATDPAQLPALLQQLVADLADPTVTYLLGGHYYDRTNHPRYRHFPTVQVRGDCGQKHSRRGKR